MKITAWTIICATITLLAVIIIGIAAMASPAAAGNLITEIEEEIPITDTSRGINEDDRAWIPLLAIALVAGAIALSSDSDDPKRPGTEPGGCTKPTGGDCFPREY